MDGAKRLSALQQFKLARRRAKLEKLLSRLTGRKDDLLLFDDVQQALALTHPKKEQLKEIPLDSIVGTVSRYYDFNRQFNPMLDSDEERWAKVKELVETKGLDPIEVYQVGDIYFVLDGNHRVSVSRHLGTETIEAYVKEFRTEVDLDPDDDIEDVVLKAEWNELMADTQLYWVRPDVEIKVTVPGRYEEVKEHIAVHRHYMGLEREEEISIEEASASWVDNVYLPAVEAIREQKLLEDFPGRTETDLYLWLKKHQRELESDWHRAVPDSDAAADLTLRFGERLWHRFWTKLISKISK
ncbi:MAG: ParB N-terminal domain-containing protein [Anaerolineales bacterium]|nr:ParB N-terminal domain-containing protein [Anaerolineales bacterium]